MLRLLLVLLLVLPFSSSGYSVLSHQANIDSTWARCLKPMLEKRYPGATEQELVEAKSFAYGGSIVQDMGFYPFGSELFTNLTHYVRSGDFVRNMLDEAHNRNEYAFALGALSHYTADIVGHPEGTNKAMPSVYPELKQKFGNAITYEEAPIQHTQLEFAFDVVQLAAGRYRTADYQRAIGFKVSKPVLERAFKKTYGLELGKVVFNVDLAVSTFRFAVRSLIPIASRAAWQSQKKEIRRLSPRARRREYVYKQSEREYRKLYGSDYQVPGTGARVLSYFVRVLPKIGPLKPFAFKLPTPEAQKLFLSSFHDVSTEYCRRVELEPKDTLVASTQVLPNTDFDTGKPTRVGEYKLTDEAYGEWLRKLAAQKFNGVTPPLKQNILAFFGTTPKAPIDEDEKKAKTHEETLQALAQLRDLQLK
ncbi:zinc dependent phospholipase C family protein [Hymenobacter taeanensis]|uniref:Zinc dependent phospholipase C family protein n=1 Tax=Hymenobacter taeanensis TaxID=2735321 RepID=A0A6M6BIQ2_9BACT|nr:MULTISPECIES: zinc dependent phospholipase C family protein [Hymenobacter]QJX47664.1 zinc dependent phospholipase C family protein [Hymenobacter taeanensis]UOQ82853.1 zinc dependent phospholipase C family protein [Hymenobacter sp. 5414T-23]